MKPDKYQLEAFGAIPDGYVRITEGELRRDDLLWSVFEKKFRRQDDPEWQHREAKADFVICAVRSKKNLSKDFSNRRSYSIKRQEAIVPPTPEFISEGVSVLTVPKAAPKQTNFLWSENE